MRATTKLPPMSLSIENDYAVFAKKRPIDIADPTHTKPLPGHGVSIFQSCVADITYRHAREPGQAFSEPMCICCGLFDPEIVVFALAGKIDRA